jgi:hypothetical protein
MIAGRFSVLIMVNEVVCEGCGRREEIADSSIPLQCSECGSTDFSPTDNDPLFP